MENIGKVIDFHTSVGNQYKLVFNPYEPVSEIEIPVFEVSLELVLFSKAENPAKIFQFVTKQIEHFLQENEVILYYYCDSSDIYYRNDRKRRFTSPQHFRSELFHALFKKENTKGLCIKNITFENPTFGNHYISFIYKEIHASYAEILLAEIQAYQK